MQAEFLNSDLVKQQASMAGFDRVEEYVVQLIERDRERLAILQGLEEARAGKVRPLEEFDREFRERHSIDMDVDMDSAR
ncbi:hypothetical protein NG895_21460 [Aeoliella sp. ICT_H6.2]|uniref:Uncharacterized protein n=1 Tax=Aeoliella straminimaris TaxID=2954799 RepID=A0A9X2FCK0_9BACT|nr:hypothetical protein [Aeoliella straminimaris]MCO6046475.1 hypothetical protein [Aeoliella straminimaris]